MAEHYRAVLIKHWLFIAICIVIVELGVLLGTLLIPSSAPEYQSYARIYFDSNPALLETTLGGTATSPDVLGPIAAHYDGLTVTALKSEITATQEASTPVVRITITDPSASRAASLADDVAAAVISSAQERAKQSTQNAYSAVIQQIQGEQTTVQSQIAADEAALNASQQAGGGAQTANLQGELNGLHEEQSLLQWSLIQAQAQQSVMGTTAHVLQPAQPVVSSGHSALLKTGVKYLGGLLVGLVLGIAILLLRDRFDQRLRSDESIGDILGWPALATLDVASAADLGTRETSAAHTAPQSFGQTFQTSLGFLGIDKPIRSLVVTAATSERAAGSAAAAIARAVALGGIDTALVDANFRHPSQGTRFELNARRGLSDAALAMSGSGQGTSEAELTSWLSSPSDGSSQLRVMPTGKIPPNPAQLLASKAMGTVCKALAASQIEMVLFDAPAILDVPDAALLATHTDGLVVMVDPEHTGRDQLIRLKNELADVPVNVLGYVVLGSKAQHIAKHAALRVRN